MAQQDIELACPEICINGLGEVKETRLVYGPHCELAKSAYPSMNYNPYNGSDLPPPAIKDLRYKSLFCGVCTPDVFNHDFPYSDSA
jgi:hypothetical protein